MLCDEEIYADVLSDVDNNSDSESDSDLDSESDIVVRRFQNKGKPIISNSESDEEISLQYDWSEVDFEPEFHICLEQSGLQAPCTQDIMSSVEMVMIYLIYLRQKQTYTIISKIMITTMNQRRIKLGLTQTLQK